MSVFFLFLFLFKILEWGNDTTSKTEKFFGQRYVEQKNGEDLVKKKEWWGYA